MVAPSHPSAGTRAASAHDPLLFAVGALGLAQITAWGTSYYCLGVLAKPIANDTGWSLSFIYFGFTAALLTMGAVSPWTGRAIDRHGARLVMALGTIIVSLGLAGLASVDSQAEYLIAWLVLGAGMRLCLYDAAFAALVQVVPSRGRLAISYLTLFGAFASTVFWVIGHFLNEALGWRPTLMLFAAINLAVCLPLNWLGLSRREAPEHSEHARQAATGVEGPPLAGKARTVAMCLFALVMSLNGFVFGVVTVQLVPLLEAAGLATAAAVWVASMKGFAQFGGRVVEIVFGRKLHAMTVGRIAIGILPLSFVLLLLGPGYLPAVIGFTLLMGASQGVITIVRGALPLALFGTAGYGAVLGLLATPILIVNAVSPTLFALVVDRWGWQSAQLALLAASSSSWLAIEAMAWWHHRRRG
ncbi:MAG: MFS transporter [Betaproteobacteria bacterium]|nr:MAG: MFS transporter [Betaproteobacteria bacterium]